MINLLFNLAGYGMWIFLTLASWFIVCALFAFTWDLLKSKDMGWIFTLFLGLMFLCGTLGLTLMPFR